MTAPGGTLVVGAGQVGTALAEVLDAQLIDIHNHDWPIDVLHVAFGWSEAFTAEVWRYRQLHRPRLTVIHSTVPVGTSRLAGAVHSPVTGRHPHLAESLITFTKFFGGPDAAAAAALWPGPSETVPTAETTEAGKLWELLSFAWQIALQKAGYEWMWRHDADPDVAYRRFAESYNAGYRALGFDRFVRPVIDDVPGPIGGHCVIPGVSLVDHELARTLLALDDREVLEPTALDAAR